MGNFIIVPGSDHVFQALFRDVEFRDNILLVKNLFYKDKIEIQINKIKSYPVIWSLFKQIFLLFWGDKNIDKQILEAQNGDILVFSNISIRYISLRLLKKLIRRGVKIVLYFIDSISNQNSQEAYEYIKKIKIDLIYTFDKLDAQKFGFIHFYTMYSKLYNEKEYVPIEYDAIFNGTNKGRYTILCDIMRKCPNATFFVNMICISDEQKKKAGFQSNVSIKYDESISYVIKSNCIIDIVLDPQQAGLSLRVYEAITYNKKLLTNNPSIKEFPYYNPLYMLYFSNVDDIDEKFLIEKIDVDYGYKGEFSPIKFLEDVKSKI